MLNVTAESLRAQSLSDFEWIIIDGSSTDNTVSLAQACGDLVSTLISEPDSGIYSAWNKALPRINGAWVLFLGAGDELCSENTLAELSVALGDVPSETTIAYGDVLETDASGHALRLRTSSWSGLDGPWATGRPVLPCHQGVLHRSSLFKQGFRYDTRCKIAADGELVLRELIAGNGARVDLTLTKFLLGGISHLRTNRVRMVAECLYINIKLGIFSKRPFYQCSVLLSNLGKQVFRLLGNTRI